MSTLKQLHDEEQLEALRRDFNRSEQLRALWSEFEIYWLTCLPLLKDSKLSRFEILKRKALCWRAWQHAKGIDAT